MMEGYWFNVSTMLRYTLEITVAFFLFAWKAPRGRGYPAKTVSYFVLEIMLALFLSSVPSSHVGIQFSISLAATIVLFILWMKLAYRIGLLDVFLYLCLALLTRNAAAYTFQIFFCTLGQRPGMAPFFGGEGFVGILIHYLIFAGVYSGLHFAVGRRIGQSKDLGRNLKVFLPLILVMLFLLPLFSFLGNYLPENSGPQALLAGLQVIYCLLIITLFYMVISRVEAQSEAAAFQRTRAMERKQYEMLEESIETIRVMGHDLKYQLRCIQETGTLDKARLTELTHALDVYDSVYKTGNHALDMILSDRSLHCKARKIDFTCIADGTGLGFMTPADIYSLFCNALDNAIEYEETVQDTESRYIHVSVTEENSFLVIRVNNYYEGPPFTGNELPKTSKRDKDQHGFGIKSILRIAEQYGGKMALKAKSSLFELSIVFPLAK